MIFFRSFSRRKIAWYGFSPNTPLSVQLKQKSFAVYSRGRWLQYFCCHSFYRCIFTASLFHSRNYDVHLWNYVRNLFLLLWIIGPKSILLSLVLLTINLVIYGFTCMIYEAIRCKFHSFAREAVSIGGFRSTVLRKSQPQEERKPIYQAAYVIKAIIQIGANIGIFIFTLIKLFVRFSFFMPRMSFKWKNGIVDNFA